MIRFNSSDAAICPFCIKYKNDHFTHCCLCEYAKLHGTCNIDCDAKYDGILKNLRRSHNIHKVVYIPGLVENMIKILTSNEDITNLKLVVSIANKFVDNEIDLLDLIKEGNIGLTR